MDISKDLIKYVENNIMPQYVKNNYGGHGLEHIKYVINRSFELVENNNLNVNMNMVYVVAAYHDIGHHIDPKTHEIISAEIMSKDKNLHTFFNDEELSLIKEAIEDHRASSNHEPRSIYGKIVSTADRNNTVEDCLWRSYSYGKRLHPEATDEEVFDSAYEHLNLKFGENGYAKFYFRDKQYEDFLKEIRGLLKNKNSFIDIQRRYITKLKKENKI